MPIAEVRQAMEETGLKNLLVVEQENTNTRYSIDTSEQSIDKVEQAIAKKFGDKLMTYTVVIASLKPYTEGEFTGAEGKLEINKSDEYDPNDGVGHDAILDRVRLCWPR